jgi:hypothetical protein
MGWWINHSSGTRWNTRWTTKLYKTTHIVHSFQLFYYGKVLEKARSMTNWTDFFFAFVKGRGWFPGTARLGGITFVEEVIQWGNHSCIQTILLQKPVREKFDVPVSPLLHIYTITHFLLSFIAVDFVAKSMEVIMQRWYYKTSFLPHIYPVHVPATLHLASPVQPVEPD